MTQIIILDAVKALNELGKAWRGDCRSYDGSDIEDQLSDISLMITEGGISIEDFRESHHLCLVGKGHWNEYCDAYECKRDDNVVASNKSSKTICLETDILI